MEIEASGELKSRLFEDTVKEPSSWLRTAQSLKLAAELVIDGPLYKSHFMLMRGEDMVIPIPEDEVFAKHDLLLVHMMLAGFAVENLVKGIIVAKKLASAKSGELDKRLSKHDLLKLCEQAGIEIQLDETEKNLLKRLSTYTVWAGRYPASKTNKDMLHSPIGIGTDSQLFKKLFNRLAAILEAEML